MRTAYTLLGLTFIVVIGGALFLTNRAVPEEEFGEEEFGPLEDVALEDNQTAMSLTLTSSAFEHNGHLPSKFTCDGENINPELTIEGTPDNTASLALIMDDPDIPQSVKDGMGIDVFDHWVVFSISPDVKTIPENGPIPGAEGKNSSGNTGYAGPCPPDGEHRYFFKLYALDTGVDFDEPPTQAQLQEAMEGHIIEQAELIGRYTRQ